MSAAIEATRPAALTPRQEAIFRAIYEGARRDGYQPGYAELCAMFKIKTKNGVSCHVMALERKGFVAVTSKARALRLLVRPDGVPFRGFADAPPLRPCIGDHVPANEMPTHGQRDTFLFLYSRARQSGFQPSVVEMMEYFRVSSHHSIHGKLVLLSRKGWLDQTGCGRSIRFLRRPDGTPFRGFVDRPAEEGGRS